MKQLEVHIMQQSYMLGCPEGQEERLMAAVKHVDEAMCGIRDTGKIRGRERIAVLAALNMAFDLIEKEQQIAALPAPAAEGEAQAPELVHPRMQALLQRMDEALAEDGRLI